MGAASPRRRFLAFAAVLTAVVAALAGVAANLALFGPLTRGLSRPLLARSDLATVLTTLVLRALLWTGLGLYLVVPAAVGGYLAVRGDRHWLYAAVWAAVAVLGLPWLVYVVVVATPPLRFVALVGGPALVALALLVAVVHGPEDAPTGPSLATFLNLVIVGVLVGGATGGGEVTAGPADDLVLVGHAWDFDYEATGDGQGLLTVTLRGETVRADSISLLGIGFADVAGADQTEPGPWRGEATGTGPDRGRIVQAGDSVTVGVTSDCEVNIVWESPGGTTRRLGQYECSDGAVNDADLEPSGLGGGR